MLLLGIVGISEVLLQYLIAAAAAVNIGSDRRSQFGIGQAKNQVMASAAAA